MHSPVPAGQCTKLGLGYTEHLPGGDKRWHPPPDDLWKTNDRYVQYVKERIAYYRGASGSAAQRRSKLINRLCQYKGDKYAWLEWSGNGAGENTVTETQDDVEKRRKELQRKLGKE